MNAARVRWFRGCPNLATQGYYLCVDEVLSARNPPKQMQKFSRFHLVVMLAAVTAAAPSYAAAGGGPKARLFAKYDTNKNGVIDGAEVDALRAAYAGDAKEELARFDTNKDGKLSDEEIAAIRPPGNRKSEPGKKGENKKSSGHAQESGQKKPDAAAHPAGE